MSKLVRVVLGVLWNNLGEVLIAKRPDGKHLGGFWEFPGGKVDEGESEFNALKREMYEEISVTVKHAERFHEIEHQYADRTVHLDCWKVLEFSGEACGHEGQEVRWVALSELEQYEFPEGNSEIISAILKVSARK